MAEDVLVKEALTPEMIEAGQKLVFALEKRGWPVDAAFWYFEPEDNRWQLFLASQYVETKGAQYAYKEIHDTLADSGAPFIELQDISVVPPRHKLPKLLSTAMKMMGRTTGVRFSRNAVDGHYIADSYIYKAGCSRSN